MAKQRTLGCDEYQMKANLRRFYSPDLDLVDLSESEMPRSEVLIQMLVGPADGPGEESFDVVICTGNHLSALAKREGPIIGRHYLVVEPSGLAEGLRFLREFVESLDERDWNALAGKISRVGRWEFEDYH
jgi:hypothetical protein